MFKYRPVIFPEFGYLACFGGLQEGVTPISGWTKGEGLWRVSIYSRRMTPMTSATACMAE